MFGSYIHVHCTSSSIYMQFIAVDSIMWSINCRGNQDANRFAVLTVLWFHLYMDAKWFQNLVECRVLLAFTRGRQGSLWCHTCCDAGSHIRWSHSKNSFLPLALESCMIPQIWMRFGTFYTIWDLICYNTYIIEFILLNEHNNYFTKKNRLI